MKKQKRILSFLLAVVMVMALLPAGAWAAAPTEVIPCRYENVGDFHEGYAEVWLNGKWGFIDTAGKEVVPCKYDRVRDFHEGYAAVRLNGKWGFIDTTGKEVVPCEYDEVMDFQDGFAKVKLDGNLGLVDRTGKKITPCQYYEMGSWIGGISIGFDENGLMQVQKDDGKYGFINTAGKEVVPCKYTDAGLFQEGLALVAIRTDDYERKYGFIDTTGAEVIPCQYGYAGSFYEGIARVSTVRMNMYSFCGYIDRTGREVVPCKYEYSYASNFHDGYGLIQEKTENGCRWLTIDHTGAVVSSHTSEHCYTVERDFDSEQNVAIVSEGGKYGAIDRNGREVIPCIYDRIDAYFLNGCRLVYNKKSAGAISGDEYVGGFDAAGKEIFPCIYDSAIVNNGYVGLIKDGYRDSRSNIYMGNACLIEMKTGNVVVPFGKYDFIGTDAGPDLVKVHIGESVYTGNWGLVNKKTGKEVVPCKYDAMHAPYEGYLAVSQNYRWGFLDTTGKEVVSCRYNDVKDFSEGYAAVRLNGKWGFISAKGADAPAEPEPSAPAADSDFVIENGVLTKYNGKGGNVVIPSGVTEIGDSAFDNCTGLTSVVIPKSVTSIGYSAFFGCTSLKSVTIPAGVTSIKNWTFAGCNLTSVTIPVSVTSIGWGAVGYGSVDEVYYGGTEAQWKAIDIDDGGREIDGMGPSLNLPLTTANIHYNATAPVKTAAENVQTVKVDGKDVSFAMYSPDNGGTNYVRLVDLAVALKGTAGQFNVGYDGKVLLTTGVAYEGAAAAAPFHSAMEYTMLDEPTYVNGAAKNLEGIRFEYQGLGYTYYKLRDLGQALGFNVGWDNANQRIYIESDKAYDPNN